MTLTRSGLVAASVSLVLALLALPACSDDEKSKDPAGSCTDLCTKSGFTSSRVDNAPNEINCFCTGTGTVAEAACKDTCTGLGKSKSQAFKASATAANFDSCQCS